MGGLLEITREDGGPSLGDVGAAYDAGRFSRRDPSFLPQGQGPNTSAEFEGGLERIWARSTHAHDNNELVDNAAELEIDRVIGTGIDDLEPDTGFNDLDEQIAAVYEFAFEAVDPERDMSLADVQALYWRERKRTGECGVRFVMAEPWGGYPFMPAIELVDAERIAVQLTGINPRTGNAVRQGVEYDEAWRRVAYHVLVAHPRDGDPRYMGIAGWGGGLAGFGVIGFGTPGIVRVPAGEMKLRLRRRRIRQLRGVPDLVSGLRTLRTEDKYVDGQMAHAQTAMSVGTLMPAPDASMFKNVNGRTPLLVDGNGNPITTLEAGAVGFYRPSSGGEIKTMHANLPGPQFEPTTRGLQRRASRALNGPYSAISGDYSQETFASNRANRIDQRQRDVRLQETGVWRPLTKPFCKLVVEWGILSRRIVLTAQHLDAIRRNPEILYRTNVPQPGNAYVNPAQESQATATDLTSCVTSQIETINGKGGNWKRTARQLAKFEKFMVDTRRELGLPDYPPAAAAAAPAGQDGGGGGGEPAAPGKGQDGGQKGGQKGAAMDADAEFDAELAACQEGGRGGGDDSGGFPRGEGYRGGEGYGPEPAPEPPAKRNGVHR